MSTRLPVTIRPREHRPTRFATQRGVDAVTVLSVYAFLVYALPSKLVFAPLGGAGTPAQILGLGCAVWWAWYHVHRTEPGSPGRRPVRIAAVVFFLAVVASYVVAMSRPIPAEETSTADLGLVALVGWTGVLMVANDGIASMDRLLTLVRRLAFAGGAVAALGIAQFATGQTFVNYIDIPGLSANQALNATLSREGFTRPAGTASHPIEYGAVLTMLLPLALTAAMTPDGRSRIRRWFPPLAIGTAIMLSISRSALVGAAVGLLVFAPTWSRTARRWLLVVVGTMLLFVFVTIPGMLGTIAGLFTGIGTDTSAQSRTDSYSTALGFLARAPIFGRGFSTFLPAYRILDNQYLLSAIEIGVVGVVALLGLLGSGIVAARRARRATPVASERLLAQALAASVAAGGVSLALFDAFSFSSVPATLFLLLGVAGAMLRLTRAVPAASEVRPTPVLTTA
jgi:O-antigen ligase